MAAAPKLVFNHPLEEVYAIRNLEIPKALLNYKAALREGRIFDLCDCSEIDIDDVNALKSQKAPTQFLQQLIDDITIVSLSIGSKRYLLLEKPISEYEGDDMVQGCRRFLRKPSDGLSFYRYVTTVLPPKWDYLMMHYIENAGYCEHGVSIRCAYTTERDY